MNMKLMFFNSLQVTYSKQHLSILREYATYLKLQFYVKHGTIDDICASTFPGFGSACMGNV